MQDQDPLDENNRSWFKAYRLVRAAQVRRKIVDRDVDSLPVYELLEMMNHELR